MSVPEQTSATEDCPLSEWKTAVRWGLQELARLAPGRAVEVRVPPAGAVQILGGTVHRRGTPPAVVEMSMETFVALAGGQVSWEQLLEGGNSNNSVLTGPSGKPLWVDASGERADIGHLFPLL
ncbi:MAG: sterol carrier family protein [Actinomycetaceae bacterium]|nr:sterol carrier family protein [Actinomycetaceae bacterium]